MEQPLGSKTTRILSAPTCFFNVVFRNIFQIIAVSLKAIFFLHFLLNFYFFFKVTIFILQFLLIYYLFNFFT